MPAARHIMPGLRTACLILIVALSALVPHASQKVSGQPDPQGMAVAAPRATPDFEMQRAAVRASLCSASNAKGEGLRGSYFQQLLDQGKPVLVRTDGVIDFDASFDWPTKMPGPRPVSARWQGWVRPMVTGRYTFHADQQTANITVARQLMTGPRAQANASIELVAGRFYPITMEVRHLDRINGRLSLEWTTPYGARFVIPGALLFMPMDRAS
ncbi:MAG: PA14 domain-containing protein [Pseudomonadota bacterium]